MTFRDLVDEYLGGSHVGNTINALITTKETQTEAETIPRDNTLDKFVSTEFARLMATCPNERELPDVTVFNDTFRRIIAQA